VIIDGVTIREFAGSGVVFGGCEDILIRNSYIEYNDNRGIEGVPPASSRIFIFFECCP